MYCERYLGGLGGREATRLSFFPFLSEVADRFLRRAQGKSPLELALYAAHDTVVAPLLAALSVFDCR